VLLGVIAAHALVISALMAMRVDFDVSKPPHVFKPITPTESEPPRPADRRPAPDPEAAPTTLRLPDFPAPQISDPIVSFPPLEPGLIEVPGPIDVPAAGTGDAIPVPATELLYRAIRSPDEYYPSASITLQEQGITIVRVCVGPAGRLEGKPGVERSSGSTRLDAAAIRWASEALVFTPATRNGAAVPACKGFRVNFTLR
jgi:TonB family protein